MQNKIRPRGETMKYIEQMRRLTELMNQFLEENNDRDYFVGEATPEINT